MKKLLLIISFILLFAGQGWCGVITANIGAAGNWTAGTSWIGGVAPTQTDDVVIPLATTSITIDAGAVCRSVDFNTFTGTLTMGATGTLAIGDSAGTVPATNSAINLPSGATFAPNAASTITFKSTSSTQQTVLIDSSYTLGNVTFNSASNGNYAIITTGLTLATTSTLTLTKGTLHTDGASDVSGLTHSWGTFSSSNANTRALNLGNSTIGITGGAGAWTIGGTPANLTLTKGGSTINMSGQSGGWSGGGKSYQTVSFTGGYNLIEAYADTYVNLYKIGKSGVKDDYIHFKGNFTVTGEFKVQGESSINRVKVDTNTLGSAITATITGATISNCTNVDFRDIAFVSTGAVNFSAIAGGSGDCGGNSISGGGALTFTTADDWFFYQTTNSGTHNFSDYSHWYDTTGGAGSQMASTRVVLPQDTAYFDASSINGTGTVTVDQDMPRVCKTLDFSNVDQMAFHMNNIAQTIYGGLTFVANVTTTVGSSLSLTFESMDRSGSYTFTPESGTKDRTLNINAVGGIVQLLGALNTQNQNINLNNGTFDASVYNLTTGGDISSSNSNNRKILMGSGTWQLNGTWNFGTTTNLDTSGGFAQGSTILLKDSTAKNFTGGGLVYNNITCDSTAGVRTFVNSNTFNVLTINAPKTVKFTNGTVTTVQSFIAGGSLGNIITLASTTPGSSFILFDTTGINKVTYCNISDCWAKGGDVRWLSYRKDGNINLSNNRGWLFDVVRNSGFTF